MRTLVIILIILLICVLLAGCGGTSQPTAAKASQSHPTLPMIVLPPPVADGDMGARPLEALSSDNPNERLQIVRQAQDKWGATKVEAGIDQKAILGRWNHPWTDAAYLLFNTDGTMKATGLLFDNEGTYRFLSSNTIEFTLPGILYGENVLPIEYRLLGDTLELKYFGDWICYQRASR